MVTDVTVVEAVESKSRLGDLVAIADDPMSVRFSTRRGLRGPGAVASASQTPGHDRGRPGGGRRHPAAPDPHRAWRRVGPRRCRSLRSGRLRRSSWSSRTLYRANTAGLFFTATSLFLLLLAVSTLGTETGLVTVPAPLRGTGTPRGHPPDARTPPSGPRSLLHGHRPRRHRVRGAARRPDRTRRSRGRGEPAGPRPDAAVRDLEQPRHGRHPGVRPDADHGGGGQDRALHRAAGARPAGRAGSARTCSD